MENVAHHWHRLSNMSQDRMNNKIFRFCLSKSNSKCKNWQFDFKKQLASVDSLNLLDDCLNMSSRSFCDKIVNSTLEKYIVEWKDININNIVGPSGRGRNKLRTYKLFKDEYVTESYVKCHRIPRKHKSAFAKFRCGVAPLRLETGRYENIPEYQRLCPICKLAVENECHVLFECPSYQNIRDYLVRKAVELDVSFDSKNNENKLCFVLSNENICKLSAQSCYDILKARTNLLYK